MRHHPSSFSRAAVCAGAAVCVLAGAPGRAGRLVAAPESLSASQGVAVEAARLMARALVSIRDLRAAKGLPIDPALDPNRTGIIGEEFTSLTTSLGEVEAKRTSANPAFAAVLAGYLQAAGLRRGDVVAVGASGSFPGFVLATLSAVRMMELEPIVIYSIGASMYGANMPGFTFVDMLERLRSDGLLPYTLAAISPGGDQDGGSGVLFDETGTTLLVEARRSRLPLVPGATLAERIERRLRIYDREARGRPIRCFVNIGGASASFGDTPASLTVPNGLVGRMRGVPASPTRGLLLEFASRGVPVVHLLHVRGLARDNHLPFDPVPLPPVR
jgi:poly-gamma-glutamate system protein